MSFLTSYSLALAFFFETTIIGMALTVLAAPAHKKSFFLYFAPIIGLSSLVIISVWIVRAFPMADFFWLLHVFAVAAFAVCYLKRRYVSTMFIKDLVIIGLLATAIPNLPSLIYGISIPAGGDSVMYMGLAEWMQVQSFSKAPDLPSPFLPEYYPNAAMLHYWQWLDAKIGGQALLALVQASYFMDSSFSTYLPFVGTCLAISSSVVSASTFAITKTRFLAVLCGICFAATSNAFVWATTFGFMPQSVGLPAGLAAITIFGIVLGKHQTATTMRSFAPSGLLISILISGMVYSYNDFLIFFTATLTVGIIACAVRIGSLQTAKHVLVLTFITIALLNLELLRIGQNFNALSKFASGEAVGWHINFQPWEFIGSAFGLRPMIDSWLLTETGVSLPYINWFQIMIALLVILTVPVITIANLYLLKHQSTRIALLMYGAAVFGLFGLIFPYMRWVVPGPWPEATGQTFIQLRTATWAAPFCFILMFSAFRFLGRSRAFFCFCFFWITTGLTSHWLHSIQITKPFVADTAGVGIEAIEEIVSEAKKLPATAPIFINLPSSQPSWHILQIFLAKRPLVGSWADYRPPPWRNQPYTDLQGEMREKYKNSAKHELLITGSGKFQIRELAVH